MTKIKDIIQYLETVAPSAYQESYDNSRLITGNAEDEVSNILITLDTTEDVVKEAIDKNCNLIVSHHPIIFKGLKSLTGSNYIERTVIKALKNDIAIYAIHTNLDNVSQGVNKKICEKLGLINTEILVPKNDTLSKLVAFVPKENTDAVLTAIHEAGGGNIGNYDNCSFKVEGTGTFTPNEEAQPHIGSSNTKEFVTEDRIEIILPSFLEGKIINALRQAHPYEEVAYYLSSVKNKNQEVGSGMVGELPEKMEPFQCLNYLKDRMGLTCIRHTKPVKDKIFKIAVCGGSGSLLLPHAIRSGADLYVTADFKYHEFFDAEDRITIADIGHYESEVYTKNLICEILSKKFTNFALKLSETVTNPISYL
ncbi:Nif3-like dinuclear metal center hexameric protein [Fulvivirga sediminis]|uniref:GTP cyclohydrolase 1 type 2 homolog n=1 Tax=Fulvivirga sediminis TaxID=2803949 RepID=A0A937F7A9_9BACT|nr:Nif3-like dinuclear metal center hexameric protein [Fulvivirga sediminis]MBL3655308.1 Nif3-like dinuclear metal center hexameric protein [Fulvivirga sediminis]